MKDWELHSPASREFWDYLDRLESSSKIIIDRPLGSAHPRYAEVIYPLDCGYLQDTLATDGDGIDVWVGSLASRELDALAMTVDLDERDAELKLMLGCTAMEKQVIVEFLNGHTMRACLVYRRQGVP